MLRRSLNKIASNVRHLDEDHGREDAAARAKLLLDSLDQLDSDSKGLHFKVTLWMTAIRQPWTRSRNTSMSTMM